MNFESIAITGHTSGIGKALYDKCISTDKSVSVYSRTNGFDIGDQSIVDKILLETKDIPVFVNNAYHPTQQLEILKKWFDIHKDREHLIINVSSIAADLVSYGLLPEDDPLQFYGKNKKDLNKMCLQLNMKGYQSKSIAIDFGVVDTTFDGVPQDLLARFKENNTVITPDDAANIILKNISEFSKNWFQSHCLIMNCDSFKK